MAVLSRMGPETQCRQCGASFVPKWGKSKTIYCSTACAGKAKRGLCFSHYQDKSCLRCGGTFYGHSNSKFCSIDCRTLGEIGPQSFIAHLLKRPSRKALSEAFVVALYEKQQGKCALTGVTMTFDRTEGRRSVANISIDRIDSATGYEESNIQLVCLVVNRMKSNMSTQDFAFWCRAVAKC